MRIILIPDNNGKRQHTTLTSGQVGVLVLVLVAIVPALVGWGAWSFASRDPVTAEPAVTVESLVLLQHELEQDKARISDIRRQSSQNLDYLGLQVGRVQAQVIRINAIGKRLSAVAGLDDGEFDFSMHPALGGSQPVETGTQTDYHDLIGNLVDLESRLTIYGEQLDLIEALMVDRDLDHAQHPTGKPVKNSWMSSAYGKRRDPFSGRPAFHRGIDFAAKPNTPIKVVADGIVIRSEYRKDYGLTVEVNHGNGYITRYAHASKSLVENGEKVVRGQEIAIIGNTGRSTGPHLHFEVLLNGKNLNPRKYLKSSG